MAIAMAMRVLHRHGTFGRLQGRNSTCGALASVDDGPPRTINESPEHDRCFSRSFLRIAAERSRRMFRSQLQLLVLLMPLTILLGAQLAGAERLLGWPSWRGEDGTGTVPEGTFPVRFGSEEFQWRAPLPGKGCSTPIVLGETIYVTAPANGLDALLAFDHDGKELWRTTFGPEDAGKHRNGSGSNASPVTDGETVFVYFKSGTLAAVQQDGSVRWSTNLVERFGKDTLFWDHGTSPVLTENHVIMARMHQGDSWLAAFNKSDGQMAWKTDRNYETPVEGDHGYTTPVVLEYAGREAILTWGAEHITIHDARSGQLMWTCGNFNPEKNELWPAIASPVVVGDMVVVAYGRNDRGIPRLHGVRLSGLGDVTETNHVWKRDDVGTFVPTPLVHDGRIIVLGDQGEVECLDPQTGRTVWKEQLPRNRNKFYSSPLLAGNRFYAPREDGVVFVGEIDDDRFRLVAENDMKESIIGSPVPLENGVLLRGEDHLLRVSGVD